MELLPFARVDSVMSDYTVRLIGRDSRGHCISLLAETGVIAIYRAATLALEAGALDFEMLKRPRRTFRAFA